LKSQNAIEESRAAARAPQDEARSSSGVEPPSPRSAVLLGVQTVIGNIISRVFSQLSLTAESIVFSSTTPHDIENAPSSSSCLIQLSLLPLDLLSSSANLVQILCTVGNPRYHKEKTSSAITLTLVHLIHIMIDIKQYCVFFGNFFPTTIPDECLDVNSLALGCFNEYVLLVGMFHAIKMFGLSTFIPLIIWADPGSTVAFSCILLKYLKTFAKRDFSERSGMLNYI
jgi:hypothetical protein